MLNLELLTRCCEVASRILQRGGAPLDMENFKRMLQNSKKCTKEGILPLEMKHRYKCNVSLKQVGLHIEPIDAQLKVTIMT